MPRPRLQLPRALAVLALATASSCADPSTDEADDDEPATESACNGVGDPEACDATMACTWSEPEQACVIDCDGIDEESVCNAQALCFWSSDACLRGAI